MSEFMQGERWVTLNAEKEVKTFCTAQGLAAYIANQENTIMVKHYNVDHWRPAEFAMTISDWMLSKTT